MQHMPPDAGLVVFLRLPNKGKVKTRLAATLGEDAALHVYNQLIYITLEQVTALQMPTYLFYEGGLPSATERNHLFAYHLQSEGGLGKKMENALSFVLKQHQKALIIGSDCPGLTSAILRDSLMCLDERDIVLGPASDGGYYLFGCKKIYPTLFEGITWSTSAVLSQTIDKIKQENLSFRLLPELGDVDTADDWKNFTSKRT